jgi:putative Mn2+ efflux pump MntP
MPLIGLALGAPLRHAIGATADYIAIGVLLAFGLYMLLGSEDDEQARLDRLTQMHGARCHSESASASTNSRSASRSACCASQPDS